MSCPLLGWNFRSLKASPCRCSAGCVIMFSICLCGPFKLMFSLLCEVDHCSSSYLACFPKFGYVSLVHLYLKHCFVHFFGGRKRCKCCGQSVMFHQEFTIRYYMCVYLSEARLLHDRDCVCLFTYCTPNAWLKVGLLQIFREWDEYMLSEVVWWEQSLRWGALGDNAGRSWAQIMKSLEPQAKECMLIQVEGCCWLFKMVQGGGQRIFFWLWYKGWFERSMHVGESNLMSEQKPVRKEGLDGRELWRGTQ